MTAWISGSKNFCGSDILDGVGPLWHDPAALSRSI